MYGANINFRNRPNTFSLSYRTWFEQEMLHRHFHETYEIYYLFSGERRFFIGDRPFSFRAGDLVLIKPNVLHRGTNSNTPGCERLLINFHENCLPDAHGFITELPGLFANEYCILNFVGHQRLLVEELLHGLLREAESQGMGFEPLLQSILVQLLVQLGRQVGKCHNAGLEQLNAIHEKVADMVRYINQHYMEAITVPSLSKHFYISASYLSKVFKEITGFTLVEYLNCIRIKEAKRLLLDSDMKVIRVAEEVGFGSISQFERVFREITGHPPLYYRKSARL
jgi:AraC-like DNA-binding protein